MTNASPCEHLAALLPDLLLTRYRSPQRQYGPHNRLGLMVLHAGVRSIAP